MRIFVLSALLAVLGTIAHADSEIVLKQPGAPLTISDFSASYKSPERGIGDGSIRHRLSITNSGAQKIEAYGIGFHVFDAFNRSLGQPFIGYDMSSVLKGETRQPGWEDRPLSAYLFRRHGTAVAFVAIARFEDGTIWKADQAEIATQLEQLELELEDDEQE